MADVVVRLRGASLPKRARKFVDRGKNVIPAWREVARATRFSDKAQFERQMWFTPRGSTRPWRRTKAFGSQPAPSKSLQRSGKLFRATQGGPGYLEQITAKQMSFGIDGSVIPYAIFVRGGSTQRPSLSPFLQKVTPKMRGFFRFKFGVNLRDSTKTLTKFTRPWGGFHPKLTKEAGRIICRYVATGKVSKFRRNQVVA